MQVPENRHRQTKISHQSGKTLTLRSLTSGVSDGVTVFLTTQYLEEADSLAHRVGIIAKGRIVAEGTPEDLKRSVGTDLIVVRLDGDLDAAKAAVKGVDGVVDVDLHGQELTASSHDGAATVSPIAVALDGVDVKVKELTLRTPTLDDVFLELTGNRMDTSEEDA